MLAWVHPLAAASCSPAGHQRGFRSFTGKTSNSFVWFFSRSRLIYVRNHTRLDFRGVLCDVQSAAWCQKKKTVTVGFPEEQQQRNKTFFSLEMFLLNWWAGKHPLARFTAFSHSAAAAQVHLAWYDQQLAFGRYIKMNLTTPLFLCHCYTSLLFIFAPICLCESRLSGYNAPPTTTQKLNWKWKKLWNKHSIRGRGTQLESQMDN